MSVRGIGLAADMIMAFSREKNRPQNLRPFTQILNAKARRPIYNIIRLDQYLPRIHGIF